MAPEVLRGERATAAADVYSLGAVLYELLTGRPPRRIESFADLGGDGPVTEPTALVPGAPPALAATIMRCLDSEPGRRPASAGELALELGGASELPTRSAAPRPAVRRTRLDRRLWLLPAALLAGLAGGLALVLADDDPPPPPPQVEPVPAAADPAEEARNLSEWLRRNSGGGRGG
jgi:serine/threonine protein kinase